jgi:murein DD-endopeptidase MepM/ murein hydrolase activator NlpD
MLTRTLLLMTAAAMLLALPASAQSSRRVGRAGISYEQAVKNMGALPAREYDVSAVEDRIDPFVGPQSQEMRASVELRADDLGVPVLDVRVVEWVNANTGETVRAVFDEEGALWYSTSTMAGATVTAETLAQSFGEPKIAQIIRTVGTAVQVFTVFAYPDRGVAYIGAGATPPFVPSGTLPVPQIPNGIPSLPAAFPSAPRAIVGEMTLPPHAQPGNLDGVVMDEEDLESEADPVKPEPEPAPVAVKKKLDPVKPAPTPKPKVAPKKPFVAGKWRSPIPNTCITSGFGPRSLSIKGASKWHKACDLRAGCGTQVKAARGGVVTHAEWTGGYGYQVRIDHGDGTSTRYSHLQKGGFKVKKNDTVDAGDVIALSGNTSSLNTKNKRPLACHLHFEVLVGGVKVNPTKYVSLSKCGGRPSGANAGNFMRP